MNKTLNDIITDPQIFLDEIFSEIEKSKIDVSDCYLDHICYRVATLSEYETKKSELSKLGELLIESMVNGRLISTFKFHSPIIYKDRKIDVIELPAPKPNKTYKSGLEHVEFVTTKTLKEFVELYPHLTFETSGIDKKINADVTLHFGEYCIRFHRQTLEDVIKEEKACLI